MTGRRGTDRVRRADLRHYDVAVPDPKPGDGRHFGMQMTAEETDRALAVLAAAHPRKAPDGLIERLLAAGVLKEDPRATGKKKSKRRGGPPGSGRRPVRGQAPDRQGSIERIKR